MADSTISGLPNASALTGSERVPMDQDGATVSAGVFVVGKGYRIASVGSTNFTAIGAGANIVGLVFVAAGPGAGNGTAVEVTTVDVATSEIAALATKASVGLGNVNNTDDDSKPISAAVAAALSGKVDSADSRLSNAREWNAPTATQADAEAGSSTTRLAFTPQRVFQAIAAWWSASTAATKLAGIASGATANATDAQLRDRATHSGTQPASTITGLFDPAAPGPIGGGTPAAGSFTTLSASAILRAPLARPSAGNLLPGQIYVQGGVAYFRNATGATGTEEQFLVASANLEGLTSLATARANLGFGALPSGNLVGTTESQKLDGKTLGSLTETVFTITDAAAFEINPANGPIQQVTLSGNRTPVAPNFGNGQSVKLKIQAGAFAITWTTIGVVWISQNEGLSGTAPRLGATGWTHIELWREGNIFHGAFIGYSAT